MDDFAKDIAARARWALIHNDGWPKASWSTVERLAVALVLDDPAALRADDFTRDEAVRRLAGDICGSTAAAEAWIEKVRGSL